MAKQTTGTKVPEKEKCPTKVKRGKRVRTAGHSYECDCADDMREIGFPYVVTSRIENRTRDGQKIDLVNSNESVNGRLPYNIQCKNSSQMVNYPALLVTGTAKYGPVDKKTGKKMQVKVQPMPKVKGVVNVIFHKFTDNNTPTGRYMTKGEFAILEKDDFLLMITELEQYKKWKEIQSREVMPFLKGSKITVNPEYAHLLGTTK